MQLNRGQRSKLSAAGAWKKPPQWVVNVHIPMVTSTRADNQGGSSPTGWSIKSMWPSSILERASTPVADPVARFPHVGSMLRLGLTRVMWHQLCSWLGKTAAQEEGIRTHFPFHYSFPPQPHRELIRFTTELGMTVVNLNDWICFSDLVATCTEYWWP